MKLEDYINNFDKDKQSFIEIMKSEPNKDSIKLFQWIINSEYNPYSIFSNSDIASGFSHIGGALGVFGLINHALYDDGDITFVKTKSWPLICFYYRKEDDFRNVFMNDIKKSGHGNFVIQRMKPVSFINSVDDYIQEYEEYEEKYQKMAEEYLDF